MTITSRFDTVSPLDSRFYGGDQALYKALHPYLSASAATKYQARVEGALALALADLGIADKTAANAIASAADRITPQEVADEETRTRHDVRALVNVIRAHVPDEARRFVHLGATSYDIVDTANALRYRECVERVLVPTIAVLIAKCISIAEAEAETPQIGRTHGRPGAVGAFNALALLADDPRALERRFLGSLGLHAAPVSTQIVPPEGWTDLAHACISALGVMANLADDMRQLQRSEIGEVAESFAPDQVGSSTMPHKRNPVSFENVKSIWKAMAPRMLTTYMDQISEHQRDLTNSASQRFLGEILAATAYAAGRLATSLDGMRVDRDRLKANLAMSRGTIAAEPLYVLLAKYGHPDAHEAVRRLTLEAERGGRTLLEVATLDTDLREYLKRLGPDERRILERPEEYRGLATQVARDVASTWRERLKGVLPE